MHGHLNCNRDDMKLSAFRSSTNFVTVGFLVIAAGCAAHHVQLNAPESDAPIVQRLDAYERLKAVSLSETHITTLNKWGAPIAAAHRTDSLLLQSGERVNEPEDLWPSLRKHPLPPMQSHHTKTSRPLFEL